MISSKRAAKLKQKKHREAERLFLAEGATLLAESPEPPLHTFDDPKSIRSLSTLTTPSGPVGIFPFLDVRAEELLNRAERIVLLHGVQDPGNVGTIIRAAHAFGAGVALSIGCADLYNPKTVRSTMGSIFHAAIARELDSIEFLKAAGASGFHSSAAVPDSAGAGSYPVGEKPLIVIGAEGSGLPERVVAACENRVTIPSLAASLNAAMAASILLYQAYSRVLP